MTGEWIKVWYILTMEYCSPIKMNEIMPFAATWMQPEMIIVTEVSQKGKYYVCYHLYVESKI